MSTGDSRARAISDSRAVCVVKIRKDGAGFYLIVFFLLKWRGIFSVPLNPFLATVDAHGHRPRCGAHSY
jgi:hypothetical protein